MMQPELPRQLRGTPSQANDLRNVHVGYCGAFPHPKSTPNAGWSRTSHVGKRHYRDMDTPQTMGARLRSLRLSREPRPTQEEVAAAVGMSRAHLAKIEKDQDAPGRSFLQALATYYGVTMDYLQSGAQAIGGDTPQDTVNREDELAWARLGTILDSGQKLAVARFVEDVILRGTPDHPKADRRRKS